VRDLRAAESKPGLLLSSLNARLNTQDKGGCLLGLHYCCPLNKNSYLEHTEEHAADKQTGFIAIIYSFLDSLLKERGFVAAIKGN